MHYATSIIWHYLNTRTCSLQFTFPLIVQTSNVQIDTSNVQIPLLSCLVRIAPNTPSIHLDWQLRCPSRAQLLRYKQIAELHPLPLVQLSIGTSESRYLSPRHFTVSTPEFEFRSVLVQLQSRHLLSRHLWPRHFTVTTPSSQSDQLLVLRTSCTNKVSEHNISIFSIQLSFRIKSRPTAVLVP